MSAERFLKNMAWVFLGGAYAAILFSLPITIALILASMVFFGLGVKAE